MTIFKNISIGFLVSFIGSIPFGYLNVIGFEILQHSTQNNLLVYLLGIIVVEVFVIYLTIYFVEKFVNFNQYKLKIAVFSLVFLSVLSSMAYFGNQQENNNIAITFQQVTSLSAFFLGLSLNAVNFVQLPFWMSTNIYLKSKNWIVFSGHYKHFYVIFTLVGTFFGMYTIIIILNYFSENNKIIHFIQKNIWFIFFVLAVLQLFQCVKLLRNKITSFKN